MERFKNKTVIACVLLFVIVTALFIGSIVMRAPYFGKTSEDHHHHLTGSTVIFTNNWLEKGAFNLGFTLLENPDSVEFPTMESRQIYDSYPPGCVIPVYIAARLAGRDSVDYAFVESVNLANQFLVTLILAYLVFFVLRKVGIARIWCFLFALVPAAAQLFLPSPFYFFQNVYFSDQAVILPFILTVFLETLRPDIHNKAFKRTLGILQGITMFFGMLTDWLFVFVVFVIYLKRLFRREIGFPFGKWLKESFLFVMPALAALALFAVQVAVNGPVRIINMFFFRTGLGLEGDDWAKYFPDLFWGNYIKNGYGDFAAVLLWASLILLIVLALVYVIIKLRRKSADQRIARLLSVAFMIILPCFMQVYALRNHSAIHDFSTLKFSLVMSALPFVFVPLLIYYVISFISATAKNAALETGAESYEKAKLKERTPVAVRIMAVACMAVSVAWVANAHRKYAAGFFPAATPLYTEMGAFLKENTGYSDVVFTYGTECEISNIRPQSLSQSMKRVYRVDGINDIFDIVLHIEGDYTVNILDIADNGVNSEPIEFLIRNSEEKIQRGDMVLYKLSKERFLACLDSYNADIYIENGNYNG